MSRCPLHAYRLAFAAFSRCRRARSSPPPRFLRQKVTMAPHHPALFLPLLFLHTGKDAAETELLTTHQNTRRATRMSRSHLIFPAVVFK